MDTLCSQPLSILSSGERCLLGRKVRTLFLIQKSYQVTVSQLSLSLCLNSDLNLTHSDHLIINIILISILFAIYHFYRSWKKGMSLLLP